MAKDYRNNMFLYTFDDGRPDTMASVAEPEPDGWREKKIWNGRQWVTLEFNEGKEEEKPITYNDGWRHTEDYKFLADNAQVEMLEKWEKGEAEYGKEFSGIPLDHAREEVYDLVFYIEKATHQQKRADELLRQVDFYFSKTQSDVRDSIYIRNAVNAYVQSLTKPPHDFVRRHYNGYGEVKAEVPEYGNTLPPEVKDLLAKTAEKYAKGVKTFTEEAEEQGRHHKITSEGLVYDPPVNDKKFAYGHQWLQDT